MDGLMRRGLANETGFTLSIVPLWFVQPLLDKQSSNSSLKQCGFHLLQRTINYVEPRLEYQIRVGSWCLSGLPHDTTPAFSLILAVIGTISPCSQHQLNVIQTPRETTREALSQIA